MMSFFVFLFWFSLSLILYTYLGYPILIILIGKLWGRNENYDEIFPSVTILIPAYNEEKFIAEKLENTLSLDYPNEKIQILVAADGASDNTPKIVESFSDRGVELCYRPERNGKMAAIVRAMELARGEIVVFSDANNLYSSQTIRELLLPFSDQEVGATTGAKLIVEDGRDLSAAEGLYWKYESAIKSSESRINSCVSSVGEILAIRRSLFVAPLKNIINDDHFIVLDLLRRGHRLIYVPQARSFEYVSPTASDEIIRRRRMNAGLFQTIRMSSSLLPFHSPLLIWEIFSHKYMRAFVPFAMIFAFISNLILYFTMQPLYQNLLIMQVTFYGIALVGNFVKISGTVGKLLYLSTFLVNSNYATLAGLYVYLTDTQPHIWKQAHR